MYAYNFRPQPGAPRWTAAAVVLTVAAAGLLVLSLFGLTADLILRTTLFSSEPHPPSQQELLVLLSTSGFETLYLSCTSR